MKYIPTIRKKGYIEVYKVYERTDNKLTQKESFG